MYRSRLAEHMLRAGLEARLGPESAVFDVQSCGTEAVDGQPLNESIKEALAGAGARGPYGRSRRLETGIVRNAHLVLCADQANRRAVLEVEPRALRRAFLLRELARTAQVIAWDAGPPPDSRELVARAQAAVETASRLRAVVRTLDEDSIMDPAGRPPAVLNLVARAIQIAVGPVVDLLCGGATS